MRDAGDRRGIPASQNTKGHLWGVRLISSHLRATFARSATHDADVQATASSKYTGGGRR